MYMFVLFNVTCFGFITGVQTIKSCTYEAPFIKYHKIKSCYKSTLPMIAWKNVVNLKGCMKFAREKRGFAFNFSPAEAGNYTRGFFKNCEVLDCPEIGNSSTLVMDTAYDYYSAYGNTTTIQNSTCIKFLGLFGLTPDKQNYTTSISNCLKLGGDLANILTEARTTVLGSLVRNTVPDWYKAVYVGLDDMQVEGSFETASGLSITCTKYRAWAPGHPRSKHRNEDCVVLDGDIVWRTVNCKVKLQALCEFFPVKPLQDSQFSIRNVTCPKSLEKKEKRKCLQSKALFEIYSNSSRLDQCALGYL